MRSPTAETVFQTIDGIEAIGAGTNSDAATPVSGDLIEWADIVFVMESAHRNKVSKKFRPLLKNKRLIVLNIPDKFDRMDDVLIGLLKTKVARHIQLPFQ